MSPPWWIRFMVWLGIGEYELVCEECDSSVDPANASRHTEWHEKQDNGAGGSVE